jgi:stage IV sporulation protein FB
MKVGVLFDIDIYINKMLVIMLIIAVLVGEGFKIAIIFLVIFIHEMAHVLVARILKLKVREIELLPFGGVVRIESLFELNPRNEICIALAGPLFNILLLMGCMILETLGLVSLKNHTFFTETNLMLAGFNLIPALPLDGGRVLRAILSRDMGMTKATRIAAAGGLLLALFLIMTGVYALYYKIFNPNLFIIAGFLMYSAIKENRMATYVFLRDITYKKDALLKEGVFQTREIIVLYDLSIKEVVKKFVPHRYHYVTVVDEQFRTKGYLTESEIVRGLMDYGLNTPISRLLF